MKGRYPKDFKFIGWHPNCRCYAVPILANEGVEGVDWWEEPTNAVTDVPDNVQKWLEANSDRIEKANNRGTLPYWLLENTKYTSIKASAMNTNRKPQIISEARKEYKSLNNKWQHILFDEVSGGYVACERGKILQSEKSKNELLKYNKELGMAKILAKNGKRVQLPEEFSREHRFDAFVDGVPSDFKRASSANNLMKYARYATQKQGAKQVVFAFPKMTDEIHRELNKIIKLGFRVMYYTEEGGALRVL